MFVVSRKPKSLSAEAYRSLRTCIRFSGIDKKITSIVVTSSIAGEGKSTISGNLALSLSQDGNKVLIIDCDLRKPSLHRKFGISNEKGITDLLIDKYELEEVLNEINSNTFVIPAGTIPPNPAEIVGSKAMENLIKKLSKNFDYVIIDTPPIIPITDGLLLAAKADATVIVARSKKIKGKLLTQSYKELKKVGANIIGSVLNDSDYKLNNKYYKYYGKKNHCDNKK